MSIKETKSKIKALRKFKRENSLNNSEEFAIVKQIMKLEGLL